jgi:hypothetical protein
MTTDGKSKFGIKLWVERVCLASDHTLLDVSSVNISNEDLIVLVIMYLNQGITLKVSIELSAR